MSSCYREAGRPLDSIAISIPPTEAMAEVLGEKHPDVLTAQLDLALSYRTAKRDDDAKSLGAAVMHDLTTVLGETHPDTCRAKEAFGTDA